MDQLEIELITKARDGDQIAFAGLVERHDARVMSLVRSILGPGFDAEEAYQEIFLKVHRSLASFRFESDFSTWIHRIAVNAALTRRRSLQRRRQKEQVMDGDDFFEMTPSSPWDNPENQHLRREILEKIEAALQDIPPRQRAVFVMKHDQGMKLKEIARALGIGEGTAKAYLFRAVENLRRTLMPYYQGK
jgi:RNA polymerase sigma-70 factor (ECF subfamily)